MTRFCAGVRRCAFIVAAAAISCIFLLLVREATGSAFVWDLVLLAGPFSDFVGGLRMPCCFGCVGWLLATLGTCCFTLGTCCLACTLGTAARFVATFVGADGVVAVFSRLFSLLIALVTLLDGSGGVGSLRATSLHFSVLEFG